MEIENYTNFEVILHYQHLNFLPKRYNIFNFLSVEQRNLRSKNKFVLGGTVVCFSKKAFLKQRTAFLLFLFSL